MLTYNFLFCFLLMSENDDMKPFEKTIAYMIAQLHKQFGIHIILAEKTLDRRLFHAHALRQPFNVMPTP